MPKKGCRLTPEHRLNIMRALKGKMRSKEIREKISASLTGRKLSSETKRRMKIRESRKQIQVQKLRKHYLEVHDVDRKFDRRRVQKQCHLCGKEIRWQ